MRHSQTTMPGLTDAEILDTINAVTTRTANTDKAWRTANQWAAAWGVSDATARRKCRKAVAAKLMAVETRWAGEGSMIREQSHYKFVGKKNWA